MEGEQGLERHVGSVYGCIEKKEIKKKILKNIKSFILN